MNPPKTRTLGSVDDCTDFIDGCLFMATGGGGDPATGAAILEAALADGLDIGWTDKALIGDETLTAMIYGMGSIAPAGADQDELLRTLRVGAAPRSEAHSMQEAVGVLSEYLGEPIGCIVVAELGACNSAAPLVVAARLGIPVVDGDYSGRAVPEEMQSTPHVYGVASDPFASVDQWGNTTIVAKAANSYMLERVGRHLSMAGVTGTAVASTAIRADQMKEILVPGTLTQCLEIGRACRLAAGRGEDPVDAALKVVDGWRLFEGTVTAKRWEDSGGFMVGTLDIDGTGRSAGRSLRAWFKNEIHVTWLDGEPWVCSPDLVTLVNPETGRGYTNTDIDVGDRVAAVGMRGLDVMREPNALASASGAAYFGFDIGYVPIEEFMRRQP